MTSPEQKAKVRAEIERDEAVQQDPLFICFWHHRESQVQWLEPGEAGLAQIEQQAGVFASQDLEVHDSIWKSAEISGAPFVIEYRSFGLKVDQADIIALVLSDTLILSRYVYAVCRHLGKVSEEERQALLTKVQGGLQRCNPVKKDEGVCAHCGLRKLPLIRVVAPGAGYEESEMVTIHNASVLLTASGGGVVSAEFQKVPDIPDANGIYEVDARGKSRKFGTGGGAGAKVSVQDLLPLSVCSRCKSARYCSAACQRNHWRTHKAECGVAT
ncbi:unnamed protein product [Polarella glacialis]|uniref:MYND-type domain-containing protein n=1 Tax=Polarella glacialis TaxID=89957 RepID=A0A813KXX6_POLGL|nr:unnamed protein product [Polarella glacialis]CAE8617239.1 unnamed protein product [Polarella glacialis]CAE8648864.1 unnamed protein product [Polarella glacialis]CAE8715445.1 unnamed protein product [Polarella glacialis]